MTTLPKSQILSLLREFVSQRPGLDFADYGDVSAYRGDSRRITQQLDDARDLIRFCELYSVDITERNFSAFFGRLSLENGKLSYCTGQYWPTEYRASVCAVLASAIWNYFRDECNYETGDSIRKQAAYEFGRGIASRWFN